MSAARIAARLRERLPEGFVIVVREEDGVVDIGKRGAFRAFAAWHRSRGWLMEGGARQIGRLNSKTGAPVPPEFMGRGGPERLADALADALLGVP